MRFSQFTMVRPVAFFSNLVIAGSCRRVPGAIVECGVWKGGMIAAICCELGIDREYLLFDSFEGLPPAKEVDGEAALQWQTNVEGPDYFDNCTATEAEAEMVMKKTGCRNVRIVKGWFSDTLRSATFSDGIALLRMDGDWYDSTLEILESLFPLVKVGGTIIIDDYHTWEGCSKAVHDYFAKSKREERIETLNGVCYMTKRGE